MSDTTRSNLVSTGGTEGLTTFEMLEILLKLFESDFQQAVFIWGPTGIGKSAIFRQALAQLAQVPLTDGPAKSSAYTFETFGKFGLIDLRVSLLDPSDLRGLPFPQQNLARWFPPEELPLKGQESRFPTHGILLLDELTHASPAVQSACYSLVLDRRVGPHELMPGWRVMAASNLATERAHTFELSSPLKNRFLHYLLRADLDAFKQWAFGAKIDPRILAFLSWYPTYLHLDNDETKNAFPTPRSWSYVSEILRIFVNGHRLHNVQACVGTGTAALFDGFLTVYDAEAKVGAVANLEDILRGKKAMKPFGAEDAGRAHAIGARLTGLVQRDAKWIGPAIGFVLSPAWDNLREIARSSISDLCLVNKAAYTQALASDDGALNKQFFKTFKGMIA